MPKILAFGASSSKKSINRQLATWAGLQLNDAEIELIDLNDFEMPVFSVDKEAENGVPEEAHRFKRMIQECDGIIISFAEHNGSYSTAFKNIFDWTSRIEKPMWNDKPMFLMATSPGKRGGKSVLEVAVADFPHRSGKVVANYSLPSFNENFDPSGGILDTELRNLFFDELERFKLAVTIDQPA
jgi:multimeric flavodoxin WrbA